MIVEDKKKTETKFELNLFTLNLVRASLERMKAESFYLITASWFTILTASTTPVDEKFSHQQMSDVLMVEKGKENVRYSVSNGKKVLKKVDKVTFDAQGKSCFFHGIILCSLSVMLHRITRVKGKFIFTLSRDYMIFVTSRTRNRTGIVCHWEHLSR